MPQFRYNRKKVALTYSAPVDEQHVWSDKELAFFAVDQHFSVKGFKIEKFLVAEEMHEDGRLHYHMFLEFDRRLDTQDARYFDVDGMHPNIGDKPGKKWCDYCAKDGNYITNFYVAKINVYKQAIQAGGWDGINMIKDAHPRDFLINKTKFIAGLLTPYDGIRNVVWIWGPPGKGKTKYAHDRGAIDVKFKNGFYSYEGEQIVVINEIDKIQMPLDEFLTITDRYPIRVNVKGAYVPWCVHTIYFTGTQPPEGVFVHEFNEQVTRRITEIIHME